MDVGTTDAPVGAHVTSGIDTFGGRLGETGTMTVDVIGEQPDKGLIVSISEQGRGTRSAPPATCVAYGNTSVICDPNKTVNPEEYTLLRFLGSNFVDPTQLDAKKHWEISQNGGGTDIKADYTINSNANGVMSIGEARTVKSATSKSTTTDVQTKIGYDFANSRPMSIDEYVTEYQDNGASGTTKTIYQTTLQFVSDTGVPKI
jgi:hypothetical protein